MKYSTSMYFTGILVSRSYTVYKSLQTKSVAFLKTKVFLTFKPVWESFRWKQYTNHITPAPEW